MAVIYERIPGTDLVKAYSDEGYKLINPSGEVFEEAVDPDFANRTYEEYYNPDESGEGDLTELSPEEVVSFILKET